ncbi:MAG: hypothetical protein WBE92_09580 [Steroidobacteraceae bacterium]
MDALGVLLPAAPLLPAWWWLYSIWASIVLNWEALPIVMSEVSSRFGVEVR